MPEASTSIRRPRRATWVPWGTSCVSTPGAGRGRAETSAAASELKLETFGEDEWSGDRIHAFHKIGIFLVKSGLERVPIGRLGSWLCGTTKLLWRHLRVQGRLSFCYPRFVYMNPVPDCRQSCAVTLRVFLLPDSSDSDGVWWLSHPSHRIDLAGHQQKCQSHLIPHNLLPHAVELWELCSSSLSSSLFNNPKPCVSAFGTQATGPTRPQSCTWMLKNKSRISSNCSSDF